jgi:hypothetical protein
MAKNWQGGQSAARPAHTRSGVSAERRHLKKERNRFAAVCRRATTLCRWPRRRVPRIGSNNIVLGEIRKPELVGISYKMIRFLCKMQVVCLQNVT